jgi:hypothetical protein
MSIVVVSRRHARPGEGGQLIAAVRRLLGHYGILGARNIQAFRGIDSTDIVTVLSEWPSLADYEEISYHWRDDPALEALCARPPERSVYRRLSFSRDMARRPSIADFILYHYPPELKEDMLTFLKEVTGPVVRAEPGLVQRAVYGEIDSPPRFLILHGWESLASREAVGKRLAERTATFVPDPRVQLRRFATQAALGLGPSSPLWTAGAHAGTVRAE